LAVSAGRLTEQIVLKLANLLGFPTTPIIIVDWQMRSANSNANELDFS